MPRGSVAKWGALAAIATAGLGADLAAQVKASERSTITQVVNGTRIEVDYARPQARGRDPLFGGVVHWGEVWTPGANMATTLEVDQAVELDGHPLEAGKYSLWLIPQPDGWTLVVSSEPRLFHTVHPQADTYVAEYAVSPGEGDFAEVLTFDFPVVRPDHATLRLRWGTMSIPFRLDVPAWEPYDLDREDWSRYEGTYQMASYDGGERSVIRVWAGEEYLEGSWAGVSDEGEVDEDAWGFQLVPLGLHAFLLGHYRDGELVGTEDGHMLFVPGEGDQLALELRGFGDDGEEIVMSRGARSE
ncbi:MAG: DUF2911 domain-containing protein [Gemmatimonadota bacterium]